MFLNNELCSPGLTWRASTVDASIVVLTDREVHRRTWFRGVLFPRFVRGFPYPAKWETQNPPVSVMDSTFYIYTWWRTVNQKGRKRDYWPFVHLAGELCEDLSSPGVVLHLSLDQCSELAHLFDLLNIYAWSTVTHRHWYISAVKQSRYKVH